MRERKKKKRKKKGNRERTKKGDRLIDNCVEKMLNVKVKWKKRKKKGW